MGPNYARRRPGGCITMAAEIANHGKVRRREVNIYSPWVPPPTAAASCTLSRIAQPKGRAQKTIHRIHSVWTSKTNQSTTLLSPGPTSTLIISTHASPPGFLRPTMSSRYRSPALPSSSSVSSAPHVAIPISPIGSASSEYPQGMEMLGQPVKLERNTYLEVSAKKGPKKPPQFRGGGEMEHTA